MLLARGSWKKTGIGKKMPLRRGGGVESEGSFDFVRLRMTSEIICKQEIARRLPGEQAPSSTTRCVLRNASYAAGMRSDCPTLILSGSARLLAWAIFLY